MKLEKQSEKYVDRKLRDAVKKLGGYYFKLGGVIGIPDRMGVLPPNGSVFFAELKGTGLKPSKIQMHVLKLLRKAGCKCYVVDHTSQIELILKENL